MIRQFVQVSGAVLTAVLLFAAVGTAQTIDGAGGYVYRHEEGLSIEKGWFGAIGGNFNDSFGAFFQVSQHTEPIGIVDVKLTILGGGPRFTGNQRSNVTYFANVLFGTAKLKTTVGSVSESLPGKFAFQPAVGVDVKAGGAVGVRFEFAPTYIKPDGDENPWVYHFMVGVVVRGG